MSTLRHPNIVQFLGVAFFPGSRLPAIVMERLLTSLHDLLEPQRPPPRSSKPFIPLSLKCSILHDVACGLAYLHERSVVHRDLTANNVLLNSGMVAKIADLGVARILPDLAPATLTFAPGASVYMPPEALESKPGEENEGRMSKYDASIDIFSFGVVAMFTISQTFPYKLLAPTYTKDGENPVGRSELERRQEYMTIVNSQLEGKHPLLVEIIEKCLDFPGKRPDVKKVLDLLVEARKEVQDEQISKNKLDLVQALREAHISHQENENQLQSSLKEQEALKEKNEKSLETIREKRQQILEENQLVQNKDRELTETLEKLRQKEEQLQTSEREKQRVQQQLTRKEAELTRNEAEVTRKEAELTRMEAELTRAEETIRREQQQIQEMRQRETELVQAKDRETALLQQQLGVKLMSVADKKNEMPHTQDMVQEKNKERDSLQQCLKRKERQLKTSFVFHFFIPISLALLLHVLLCINPVSIA
ncbi:Serine/threonine-protein kinase STY17, partial [Geodia barretti]